MADEGFANLMRQLKILSVGERLNADMETLVSRDFVIVSVFLYTKFYTNSARRSQNSTTASFTAIHHGAVRRRPNIGLFPPAVIQMQTVLVT